MLFLWVFGRQYGVDENAGAECEQCEAQTNQKAVSFFAGAAGADRDGGSWSACPILHNFALILSGWRIFATSIQEKRLLMVATYSCCVYTYSFLYIAQNLLELAGDNGDRKSASPKRAWVVGTCRDKGREHACTLPETNPENRPSQKESSIPTIHFQGLR